MGARRAMAAVESALADRAPFAPARRASLLDGIRRGAIGLALALAASLLALYGLARLGAIGANTSQIAQSNTALAIAVWQGDGGTLQAVASPQGGLAIYRNAQRIAWVRGHSAAIVSAAFVDNGRAVLTLDANGQSRLTQIGTAGVGSAFETHSALKALDEGLWRPYGAPVARAVYALFEPRPAVPTRLPVEDAPLISLSNPAGTIFRDRAEGLATSAIPEMVVIPAGSFLMGSPDGEVGRDTNEGPQRRVTIAQPFAVGRFEVTFDEYDACVAAKGCAQRPADSGWGRGRRPVLNVSWNHAQDYVRWLSQKTGQRYRLLSEAEWEYAARAGTTTRWSFGDDESQLGTYAWFRSNSGDRTQPVGGKTANRFGLHDVHGNVWEWVEDCYADNYSSFATNGSANTTKGCAARVIRGGSWSYDPRYLRSAFRYWSSPTLRGDILGFRLARTL